MNCPAGQEEYNGICVPSSYTPAEKAAAYAEWQAKQPALKKSMNISFIVFGIAGVIAAIAAVYVFYH